MDLGLSRFTVFGDTGDAMVLRAPMYVPEVPDEQEVAQREEELKAFNRGTGRHSPGTFDRQQVGRIPFDSGSKQTPGFLAVILRHEPLDGHARIDRHPHRSRSSRMSMVLSVCFVPEVVAAKVSARSRNSAVRR